MARRRKPPVEPDDEDGLNLHGVMRASAWLVAAGLSVAGAVMAAQTEAGARRLEEARAQIPALTQSLRSLFSSPRGPRSADAAPGDIQAQQLAEAVRSLAADRDWLLARLEAIERNVDAVGAVAPAPEPGLDGKAAYGIDIGGARTLEGVRARWSAAKAQHGARFDGLHPIIVVREEAKPGEVEFRLVAGPLPSAAAAARWCAALAETLRACRPVPFEGQRLAVR